MAGLEGIGPPTAVLETAGIPLTYRPLSLFCLAVLFGFFVQGLLAAEAAKFIQFQIIRVIGFVFLGPIILPATNRAG